MPDLSQKENNIFKIIVENAGDGILVATGKEGKFSYVNNRFSKMTKYSVSELLKMTIKDLIPLKDLNKTLTRQKERIAKGGEDRVVDVVLIKKDKKKIITDAVVTKIIWGSVPATLVFFRDVSRRRVIEDRLKQERYNFEKIIENSPFGISVMDTKGRFLKFNKAWKKIFKVAPPKEYSIFKDPIVGKQRGLPKEMYETLIVKKKVHKIKNLKYNAHNITPIAPNVTVIMNVTGIPILDKKSNKVEFIVGFYEDITENVQAKQRLHENIEELQKINQLLTGRELKMIELKNKVKKLERRSNIE